MPAPVVDLVLTLLMSLIPTLLFLGLVRGLERLRDDELISRVRQHRERDAMTSNEPQLLGEFDGAAASGNTERPQKGDADQLPAAQQTTCPACDTVNAEVASFCRRCLQEL